MANGKKRQRQIAAKRQRKVNMVAGYDDITKAPSKYRMRKAARLRNVPMQAREHSPWWIRLAPPVPFEAPVRHAERSAE